MKCFAFTVWMAMRPLPAMNKVIIPCFKRFCYEININNLKKTLKMCILNLVLQYIGRLKF